MYCRFIATQFPTKNQFDGWHTNFKMYNQRLYVFPRIDADQGNV